LATGLKLWNASFHHSFKVVVLEVGVGDLCQQTMFFNSSAAKLHDHVGVFTRALPLSS
jgi:hypothetical protein